MLVAFLHNDIDYFPFLIQSGISFFVLIFHEMVVIGHLFICCQRYWEADSIWFSMPITGWFMAVAIVYRVAWWLVPVKMHKVSMIFLDSLLFGAKIK
ncbi:hypothetical protein [Clostridium facile]|uniref:Acyltransferase family protein n=1 Tax=Clostridium facile TaxID=2763035 RepID=A0ABR7IP39_9CLOT|nr:hypothetical protein [Clostridium facile]MBC5786910.1 hypothetical protein [Clostridium facile]